MGSNLYDGKDFIGLDRDILGNGLTEATTRPLSTFVENRINANTRYLASRGGEFAQSWNTNRANPRKVGSIGWTTRLIQRIAIKESDDGVQIYMNGEVKFAGASDAMVSVRARLRTSIGESSSILAENVTVWQQSASYENSITIDTSALTFIGSMECILTVEIRSYVHDAPAIESTSIHNVTWGSTYPYATLRSEFEDKSATFGPLDGTTYFKVVNDPASLGVPSSFIGSYDILSVKFVDTGDKVEDEWIGLLDSPFTSIKSAPGTSGVIELHHLSYLEVLGWEVKIISNPDKPFKTYSPKSAPEMVAQSLVNGQHVSKQAANIDAVHYIPKIVAAGPNDGTEYGPTWGDNRSRWKTISAQDGSNITSLGFKVNHPKVRVVVRGLCVGLDIHSSTLDGTPIGNPGVTTSMYTSLGDVNLLNANWQLAGGIYQFNNGQTWAGGLTLLGSAEDTPEIRLFQASADSRRPLLRQLHFAFHSNVYTLPWSTIGQVFTGEWDYTLHEGSLFTREDSTGAVSDLNYLTPFSFTFELDNLDSSRPLSFLLAAKPLTRGNIEPTGEAPPDIHVDDIDLSRIFLTVLGVSISVEPLK